MNKVLIFCFLNKAFSQDVPSFRLASSKRDPSGPGSKPGPCSQRGAPGHLLGLLWALVLRRGRRAAGRCLPLALSGSEACASMCRGSDGADLGGPHHASTQIHTHTSHQNPHVSGITRQTHLGRQVQAPGHYGCYKKASGKGPPACFPCTTW